MLLTEDFSLVLGSLGSTEDRYERMFSGPEPYTSVGHMVKFGGDWSHKNAEKPILWMYDGQIQKQVADFEEGKTAHSTIWGTVYGKHYYGRYEPWTGRLTVVKPERMRLREIPEVLLQELHQSFPGITEIREY